MKRTALKTTFEDPGEFDIGDTVEAVGADTEEGSFACCPIADDKPLYVTACGVTRCAHCRTVVAV